MAEAAAKKAPDSAGNVPASDALTATFLKLSGYKEADLIGSNEARRCFVTSNGGKYVVTKSGKGIRPDFTGPDYPNLVPDDEEEEDE